MPEQINLPTQYDHHIMEISYRKLLRIHTESVCACAFSNFGSFVCCDQSWCMKTNSVCLGLNLLKCERYLRTAAYISENLEYSAKVIFFWTILIRYYMKQRKSLEHEGKGFLRWHNFYLSFLEELLLSAHDHNYSISALFLAHKPNCIKYYLEHCGKYKILKG